MKPWQREVFANTVHVYMFLAETKHYVSKNLMAVTGCPIDFTFKEILQRNKIHLTRCLLLCKAVFLLC